MACFGVTHHIPTAKLRLDFFKMLGKSVNSGGYLVVTFWQFDIKKSYKIREFEKLLGKNDFILGWDNKPNLFRYCHLYDDKEKSQIDKLLNKSGLFLAEEFLDIGNDGAGSHYFIWRKN
ncbi:MAG: hypothetical protein KatS3mg101_0696 [Patescibacteria group bacterium]|nr:MAG: hypothetical protein KatS3mg101_0696 [Patescibacteria group bacterium]